MPWERLYHPDIDTSNALNAAAEKGCRREDMAWFYLDCIRSDAVNDKKCDFKAINAAILALAQGIELDQEPGLEIVRARQAQGISHVRRNANDLR